MATWCPACQYQHAWNVGPEEPSEGSQVAHFLLPALRMGDGVVHSCRHQRRLCSRDCVDDWLAATGSTHGYVMDLGPL